MKIAIHHRKGSFSEKWIAYCQQNKIAFKLVNCFDNDIIEQLEDCDALMWHYHHANLEDRLIAPKLIFTLEQTGKKVFPNFNTTWHFDDKIGQKYLLEATGAPIIPTYIYTNKKLAIEWAQHANYPKVFKLKSGAGGINVKLVNTKKQALRIINKAFKSGFKSNNRNLLLKDKFEKLLLKKITFLSFLKYFLKEFSLNYFKKEIEEYGYVYFQDFIANNTSDFRIIVIGQKAFAIKRIVRKNDFRASGSGNIIYLNDETIDQELIRISFSITEKIKSQCVAFDFVYHENSPLLVEISYGFAMKAYDLCPGYWNHEILWIPGNFNPQAWMVENLILETYKK